MVWGRRLILALVTVLVCAPAYAVRIPLDRCRAYAEAVLGIAEMRDVGADLQRYIALQRRKSRSSGAEALRFAEAEIRRVYRLRSVPAEDLQDAAYKRCIDNLGELPEETEG